MTGLKPRQVTVHCTDSAGHVQYLHIDSTTDGRIAAARARGATLYFAPREVIIAVNALTLHIDWIMRKGVGPRAPRRRVNCSNLIGEPQSAKIGSTSNRVTVFREGGIELHLDPRSAVHLAWALTAHLYWVMPRWVS